MNDYLVSMVRTLVPAAVAAVLTWLATRWGVVLDEGTSAQVTTGVTSLVLAVYYAAARAAESRWPAAGWLLGAPVKPSYGVATDPE